MGANFGKDAMMAAKGGLTGVGQGLSQINNPNPQYNFSALQQGFQNARAKKPALGKGVTPNSSQSPQTTLGGNINPWV